MDEESLDHTGFLLQRLQELKNWQRHQEEQLLKEQDFQIEQIFNKDDDNNKDVEEEDDDDDDTTIDQDLSSLRSEEVVNNHQSSASLLPSWASRSSSSLQMDRNPDDEPIRPIAKTFEELLLENLAKEEMSPSFAANDKPVDESSSRPNTSSSGQKAFLRRGSGLARFGLSSGGKKSSGSKTSLNSSIDSKSRNVHRLKTSVSCPNVANMHPPKKSIMKTSSSGLKLKPTTTKPKAQNPSAQKKKSLEDMVKEDGLYDSVELSFMGKLEKAEKKDVEDLRAFELLEEAALDSSFCSTSSKVKELMGNMSSMMPSPIPKRSYKTSSAGKAKELPNKDQETDDNLMKDIQAFLQQKGAILDKEEDEDDNNTIIDDDDPGIVMDANGPQQLILNGDSNWSSDDEGNEQEGRRKLSSNGRKNVHFRDEAVSFSPPRVPRHSPSYLIWSIFTKEREERRLKEEEVGRGRKMGKSGPNSKQRAKSVDRSPMSLLRHKSDYDFETTMLNAKLAELQKEVEHFQKENAGLNLARRKLALDRKQLAKDVQEFELSKEVEKKKLDEEKKRLKRDRTLLEKSVKDKKANYDQKALEEIEELQGKVQKLTEELQRKEAKWAPTLAKLQEQVKILEKENQLLHEENHKLKLKTVSSKVSTHLIEKSAKRTTSINDENNTSSPDSGLDNPEAKIESDPSSKSSKLPQMSFSPAESLDSDMTLVSSSLTMQKTDQDAKEDNLHTVTIIDVKKNETKGTTEKVYSDGSIEIVYSNGNRKDVSADGKTTKVYYYNGDIKETLASGLVKYFYSQTQTWHLTYPDGKEVLQFNNGQEEIRYPNGTLQISFPDGSVKRIDVDGTENIKFPDGTKVIVAPNGDRTLLLPSGQKEIHTSTFKRREYPDGTVKILHDDGKLETRYTSGRVRIKDGNGKLLHDSNSSQTNLPIKV